MNEQELRNMMFTAQIPNKGPFVIRYPRGRGVLPEWKTPFQEIEIGKGRMIRDGKDLAIISIGHVGNDALEACKTLAQDGIDAALYDIRFLKPIDEELLHLVFKNHKLIITVEDGVITGGLGSAVAEFQTDNNYHAKITRLGIPDRFISHGTQDQLHHECGYDIQGIVEAAKQI
jgi:1-deoxy-D-xylulose-5-phosphate synthase